MNMIHLKINDNNNNNMYIHIDNPIPSTSMPEKWNTHIHHVQYK